MNITAQCAPSILITKPKFHFLVHLPAYIRRFGPAIVFSTERYESFNHVFRLSCIYSNRQAPSRDTCRIFSGQDTVKHIATGGYWYDSTFKKWVCAGQNVLCYLDEHPEQVRLLGLPNSSQSPIPGKPNGMHYHCTIANHLQVREKLKLLPPLQQRSQREKMRPRGRSLVARRFLGVFSLEVCIMGANQL